MDGGGGCITPTADARERSTKEAKWDSVQFSFGYYPAFSFSNVRAERRLRYPVYRGRFGSRGFESSVDFNYVLETNLRSVKRRNVGWRALIDRDGERLDASSLRETIWSTKTGTWFNYLPNCSLHYCSGVEILETFGENHACNNYIINSIILDLFVSLTNVEKSFGKFMIAPVWCRVTIVFTRR